MSHVFKLIGSLAALILVLTASSDKVSACTCSAIPSACAGFQGTPTVFVGLVKSIEEERATIQRFGKKEIIRTGLTAHFMVEESLKGISATEVDVITGGGNGDCGYDFKANTRYLVFAYPSVGESVGNSMSFTVLAPSKKTLKRMNVLSTSICTRTRALLEGQDDLLTLRAFMKGESDTRVFGVVSRYAQPPGTYEYNIDYVGPMKNIPITIEGERGRLETKTDEQGRYRFTGLGAGKYKLTVNLPAGYGSLFSFERTYSEFELTSMANWCWRPAIARCSKAKPV